MDATRRHQVSIYLPIEIENGIAFPSVHETIEQSEGLALRATWSGTIPIDSGFPEIPLPRPESVFVPDRFIPSETADESFARLVLTKHNVPKERQFLLENSPLTFFSGQSGASRDLAAIIESGFSHTVNDCKFLGQDAVEISFKHDCGNFRLISIPGREFLVASLDFELAGAQMFHGIPLAEQGLSAVREQQALKSLPDEKGSFHYHVLRNLTLADGTHAISKYVGTVSGWRNHVSDEDFQMIAQIPDGTIIHDLDSPQITREFRDSMIRKKIPDALMPELSRLLANPPKFVASNRNDSAIWSILIAMTVIAGTLAAWIIRCKKQ
jgi:hypothetical protein